MAQNTRIILINTFHPGNIGATARAMKTMGLSDLYLVNPKDFPALDATSMAAGAQDVLDHATVVDTFDEAIADCSLVIGSSARSRRTHPGPELSSRQTGSTPASRSSGTRWSFSGTR